MRLCKSCTKIWLSNTLCQYYPVNSRANLAAEHFQSTPNTSQAWQMQRLQLLYRGSPAHKHLGARCFSFLEHCKNPWLLCDPTVWNSIYGQGLFGEVDLSVLSSLAYENCFCFIQHSKRACSSLTETFNLERLLYARFWLLQKFN